jgi:hypothetical protein
LDRENAISGSMIQNLAKQLVFEFSAPKVGPKVQTLAIRGRDRRRNLVAMATEGAPPEGSLISL